MKYIAVVVAMEVNDGSMHHNVKRAIVRQPGPNFANGVTTSQIGSPSWEKAVEQHNAYCDALRQCGVDVICLPADPAFPDSCFVEDTAIVTETTVVITNPGHQARSGEQVLVEEYLRRETSKNFRAILEPAKLDGGDVLRIRSHFYIGITERTNELGATQLAAVLESLGFTSSTVEVKALLHLKTGITRVTDDTIVCVSELAHHPAFSRFANKIVVPIDEHPAANCLAINGKVIMAGGCARTEAAIRQYVPGVVTLDMSEFQKMDGGLTCLSLLW